ncbi:hypothetical protein HYALB_00013550 [Hymenoscyphus albidus]|uniref:Uncharacterized protein n=1 Tax=Hymenoscyphus albidus TaxID=595503 RepID=A0A9N9LTM1_9HELO|nr:hypothetical protein HYALB_00013550 [Hymenoscyphus albidus]
MAICCFKEATKILATLESFEVDMSFKRVQSSDINEVVFAAFIPQLNKIMTFVRVYVNQQSTEMYTTLFREVFRIITLQVGHEIKWQHLHKTGFGCIVMDMDSSQMSGFGRYLAEVDVLNRSWQWHVKQAIIYCTIHFKRGILRAAGTGTSSTELHKRMEQLLYTKSREEYFELCDLLIDSEYSSKQVVDWTKHKQHECIASGINPHCTGIQNELFERTRRHTNAVEQTHFKSNSLGKRLSLLKAVKYGELLYRRDMNQYKGKVEHGVNHTWRSNALSARFAISEAKERRKRRQEEAFTNEDNNDNIDFLSNASSSGYSRSSSRSSSRSRGTRRVSHRAQTPIRRALSQAALNSDTTILEERQRLQLQEDQARVRRLELENRDLELQLERRELELIEFRNRIRDQS